MIGCREMRLSGRCRCLFSREDLDGFNIIHVLDVTAGLGKELWNGQISLAISKSGNT